MANLASIAPITTKALTLSNLILVSPQSTVGYQPQDNPILNGNLAASAPTLLFHYEGEQSSTLESDITDHFVEDNTAVNDQIALKPEIITTHGFIGDLNDVVPDILKPLKFIADKLTVVSAYTPALTAAAIIAYNEAAFLYATANNALNSAVSSWSTLAGTDSQAVINGNGLTNSPKNQTKQQIVYQQFYGYWRKKTLFTIQTPWAVFENMAIKTLRAVQSEETRMISDFEVTFKLMRFASTITTQVNTADFQLRAAEQAAGITDLGTSSPSNSVGLGSQISSSFPGAL